MAPVCGSLSWAAWMVRVENSMGTSLGSQKSEVKSQKQVGSGEVGSGEEGEEDGEEEERYEEGRPAVETSVPVPLRLRTMSGRPCAAASTRASRWTSGQPVSAFSIARSCVRCGMGRARRSIAGSAVK